MNLSEHITIEMAKAEMESLRPKMEELYRLKERARILSNWIFIAKEEERTKMCLEPEANHAESTR